MPRYLAVLGASSVVIGVYGSLGTPIGAVVPYPGERLSDRIGSRHALTLFGLASTLGFVVWWARGLVDDRVIAVPGTGLSTRLGVVVFVGSVLARAGGRSGRGRSPGGDRGGAGGRRARAGGVLRCVVGRGDGGRAGRDGAGLAAGRRRRAEAGGRAGFCGVRGVSGRVDRRAGRSAGVRCCSRSRSCGSRDCRRRRR